MIHFFRSFGRNAQGIALIEFATLLPILLILLYGTIEVTRFVQFHQKLSNSANQMSNLVNQSLNLTLSDANIVMGALEEMMRPFPVDGASVYITAIQQNDPAGRPADVMWQVKRGPDRGSQVAPGGKGSKVSLNNYTLVQRDQVVAIEVYAAYQPIIWPELFADSSMMQGYVYSLYRPRYGSFQFEPR